jgi:dipeptidyl aminopeptidase/acylaminoacyl peptidase
MSQGGFSSLWLATKSQRYKAVVSINGWSDPYTDFFSANLAEEFEPDEIPNEGDSERYLATAGTAFSMGGTPWSDPMRYLQNSPLWHSIDVQIPILLIHSDMDQFRVDQYQMFFTSLYLQNKTARLLIYRGEGHSPSSPANIRNMWKNIDSWFDKFLMTSSERNGQ